MFRPLVLSLVRRLQAGVDRLVAILDPPGPPPSTSVTTHRLEDGTWTVSVYLDGHLSVYVVGQYLGEALYLAGRNLSFTRPHA